MKKLLLLFIFACMIALADAQVYVGGSVSVWVDENKKTETTTLDFLPEVGFVLSDRWSLGTVLGYTQKEVDGTSTNKTFEFAPYARFSFYRFDLVRLFVDANFSLYSSKAGKADRQTTYGVGLKPGVALDLSDRISLVAKYGFFGYRQYDDDHDAFGFNINGNGLSLGMFYTF
ncbi:MAG: porin family protein [Tannerella sp.]|jgi:hypothetical protein|nr:porin family protein [Tannerella sp.]